MELTTSTSQLTTILVLTFFVERLSEYFLVPILDWIIARVASLMNVGTGEVNGKARMVLIGVMNAAAYGLIVGYDFASWLLTQVSVQIDWWQGLALSCIIVGGGTNLVHDVLGIFQGIKSRNRVSD